MKFFYYNCKNKKAPALFTMPELNICYCLNVSEHLAYAFYSCYQSINLLFCVIKSK